MRKQKKVIEQPTTFTMMQTQLGVRYCIVPEFKPAEYKGLNRNHRNSKHVALKPTNVGNPCKTK